MSKVEFTTWGNLPSGLLPDNAYALCQGDEMPSSAVERSINRRLNRHGCYVGTWSCDGSALSNGRVSAIHYAFAVCYGAGSIMGQGHVAVYRPEED
jgi:hypothetical protein